MRGKEFQRAGGALSFAQPALPGWTWDLPASSFYYILSETQDKEGKTMESQLLPVVPTHK